MSEPAEGGVGGFAGMKKAGMLATEEMMATYKIMLGMSLALFAQKGEMS